MEEIKVTKAIKTKAVFTWGNAQTGLHQTGGFSNVENEDPKNLEIDPRVVNFYFGYQSILTDETGRTYIPSDYCFDSISPTIYCGKALTIEEALAKFAPNTWQHDMILACQKDGLKRISVSAGGFVEGMDKDGLTLEEYIECYEMKKAIEK